MPVTPDLASECWLIERLAADEDDLDLLRDLLLAQRVAVQAEHAGLLLQPVQGALQVLHGPMVLGRQRRVWRPKNKAVAFFALLLTCACAPATLEPLTRTLRRSLAPAALMFS
jgi:hypothetical protein